MAHGAEDIRRHVRVYIGVFVALMVLTLLRGAKDPVCGMTVDRHAGKPTSEHAGRAYYFCGEHCKHTFDQDPEAYT
jgi:YHS domain-containing protein